MKRTAALGIVLLGVLGRSPADAQQTGRVYRVGILSVRTPATDRPFLAVFRRTLSGLGYHEGANLEIDYRGADLDTNRLPQLAADLIREKPDAIVASGPASIAAAKRATSSVPIVMTQISDPVAQGFVASLARPGGNITGTTSMEVELVGKRLQLLKELVPHLRRVAFTRNPSNIGNVAAFREAESVARAINIAAFAVDIESADQIGTALRALPHLHADAVLVFPDSVMVSNISRTVQLVAVLQLPAVYPRTNFAAAGGLMSYEASSTADSSQTATFVDRIFKGAKPADLPVERPTTFDLTVNLKTARTLGITVPQSILLQATQVIR